MVDAVDEHAAEGHPRRLELAPEEDRLVDGLALRGRHQEEDRLGVGQQGVDLLGALLESVDEPAERAEEHREILQEVHSRDALEHGEHDARPATDDAGGEAGRAQEDLERPALEELGEAVGGVEEVQRVARGRRVEHEQIEVVIAIEVVELAHRRVLLGAGDGVRQLLVDPVGEDVVARALVGREALDDLVERALGVEHHRPELALHLDPRRLEHGRVDEPGLVAQLLEPEGVGQPLGRVDGHHRDLAPFGRHPHGDRRRDRRLAHASGPAADAHALVGQQLADVHRLSSSSTCERESNSSGPSSGSNRKGSRAGSRPVASSSRASCSR